MSAPSQSRENRLFLTNNYSIMSKYSASKNGYFKDPILEDFIDSEVAGDRKLISSRTALVNRGYWARQMAMEWVVDRTLAHEAIDCVIVLGAGFDTLSLRYCSKFKCHWIEIDLPYVMEMKRKYINTKMDFNVIISSDGSATSFSALNLHLISCDLRNQTDLMQKLSAILQNTPCDERRRVAVINEVCLCYLEPIEVRQIFETLKQLLGNSGTKTINYIGFEQIKAYEGSKFARVMTNHFDYMSFPLKNFPTENELLDLLVNKLNFCDVTIINMYQVYHYILFDKRRRTSDCIAEPFDEFEELDLYLSHYALVTGKLILNSNMNVEVQNQSRSLFRDGKNSESCDQLTSKLNTMQLATSQRLSIIPNTHIKRYGHSSCVIEDNAEFRFALLSGGFGKCIGSDESQLQHKRLDDCALVGWVGKEDVVTLKLNVDSILESRVSLSRMHGQVCHLENGLVFFTGGRQSPQKRPGALDDPFVARVDKTNLRLEFVTKMKATNALRWRHKTLRLSRNKLIQVGGINGDLFRRESSLNTWDLSSDKFGSYELDVNDGRILNRHSFGADMMDANTLLIFGGLSADSSDSHINTQNCATLIDLRSIQLINFKVDNAKLGYNSDVIAISDHQFIRLGGLSTSTGLPQDVVELYDLRNNNYGLPITSEPMPYVEPNDADLIIIPTKMTSAHFKQAKEIVSIGGGGNLFTFGTHFNESHLRYSYSS